MPIPSQECQQQHHTRCTISCGLTATSRCSIRCGLAATTQHHTCCTASRRASSSCPADARSMSSACSRNFSGSLWPKDHLSRLASLASSPPAACCAADARSTPSYVTVSAEPVTLVALARTTRITMESRRRSLRFRCIMIGWQRNKCTEPDQPSVAVQQGPVGTMAELRSSASSCSVRSPILGQRASLWCICCICCMYRRIAGII